MRGAMHHIGGLQGVNDRRKFEIAEFSLHKDFKENLWVLMGDNGAWRLVGHGDSIDWNVRDKNLD